MCVSDFQFLPPKKNFNLLVALTNKDIEQRLQNIHRHLHPRTDYANLSVWNQDKHLFHLLVMQCGVTFITLQESHVLIMQSNNCLNFSGCWKAAAFSPASPLAFVYLEPWCKVTWVHKHTPIESYSRLYSATYVWGHKSVNKYLYIKVFGWHF